MSDVEPQPSWRVEKAARFLRAAQRALEAEDWETAVSRAYYAVYHAVIALLEAKTDLEIPRRHSQLHNLLRSSNFPGLLTREEIAAVAKLYLQRQTADYEQEMPDGASAADCLETAQSACEKIEAMVRDGHI